MIRLAARMFVALALAASTAHADPAADAARLSLERGISSYRAGDYARAHDDILEANRLAPDQPEPYRWLALAEAELDDCRSALLNIEAFLSRVSPGDPRVAEQVALRDRCLHTGRIDIDSAPSGAVIRVDGGRPIATTPAKRLAMRAGSRQISIEKPGFATQTSTVEVRPFGANYAMFNLAAEQGQRPLFQRWWFWAALGAAAITVGVLAYDSDEPSEPRLPPVTCTSTGCRP